MKRILLSAITVLAVGVFTIASAQSQRTVLVQHFTQASCGPCASANPTLENTLNNNAGSVVAIKHQVSWPGFDSMNEAYPEGPEDVRNYYGVTGVPNTVMDGTAGPGAPNTVVTNSSISSRAAVPSPFDINLTVSVDPETQTLNVTMENVCTQAVSGNLRAYIAVTEKYVTSTEEPGGTNGETEYHDVLRQYLPGTNGTNLASAFTAGQTETVTESWSFNNGRVIDFCDISVVAFIQDNTSKEVHQAAKVDANYTPTNPVDGGLLTYMNLPNGVCFDELSTDVAFVNWGMNAVTSASIDYNINGGTNQNENWTGNIPSCLWEVVTLPAYSYTVGATNTLSANIIDANGSADQHIMNNDVAGSVDEAPNTDQELELTITTAQYANELWWEVTDGSGAIIASDGNENVQGNYDTGNFPPTADPTNPLENETTYNWTIPLPTVGCFTFTLYDYFGDGLLGYGAPSGSWTLKNNNGVIAGEGVGNFGGMDDQLTKNNTPIGIEENVLEQSLSIYPNPTNDNATVQFSLQTADDLSIDVFNVVGAKVMSVNFENAQAGEHLEVLDFSTMNSGLYYINIVAGELTATKKLTVNK